VSIMEFTDGYVTHETQYFADGFAAPSWRAALAEPRLKRHRQQRSRCLLSGSHQVAVAACAGLERRQ